jgi:hypothetical protein
MDDRGQVKSGMVSVMVHHEDHCGVHDKRPCDCKAKSTTKKEPA